MTKKINEIEKPCKTLSQAIDETEEGEHLSIIDNMSLNEKLCHIQNEVKAPKSMFNTYGNFSYRNAESIMNALKPLCEKYHVLLHCSSSPVVVGNWQYIKATVSLRHWKTYDLSFETIEAHGYARECETKKGMDASQITGSAKSYATKYALGDLFLLDDNKDADAEELHMIEESTNDVEQMKTLQLSLNKLKNQLEKVGVDVLSNDFVDFVKVKANVENLDSGFLSMHEDKAKRVLNVYAKILESKQNNEGIEKGQ